MSVDAAGFLRDEASGLLVPAVPQARRSVLPWGDLNVVDPPYAWSQISPDLLSTLAVLVAQGIDRPRLLTVDASGALKTSSRVNAVTRLGASLPALATVATVLDTSQFFPGDHVAILANGAPANVCVDVIVKSIDSPTQMTFAATCGSVGFAVGDFVVGEQTINIRQIFEAIQLQWQLVQTAVGSPGVFDANPATTTTINGHRRIAVDAMRGADSHGTVFNATPGAASITFSAPGAGFYLVVKDVVAISDNRTGAAVPQSFVIRDGLSGVGTIKYLETTAAQANSVDKVRLHDYGMRGSVNTPMTFEFTGNAVNVLQTINVGVNVEG